MKAFPWEKGSFSLKPLVNIPLPPRYFNIITPHVLPSGSPAFLHVISSIRPGRPRSSFRHRDLGRAGGMLREGWYVEEDGAASYFD